MHACTQTGGAKRGEVKGRGGCGANSPAHIPEHLLFKGEKMKAENVKGSEGGMGDREMEGGRHLQQLH